MAREGLADEGERADVEPAGLIGDAVAQPAPFAELSDEVAAGPIEFFGLGVVQLGFTPALETFRERSVAVVEKGPLEEGSIASPGVMLNLFQHPDLHGQGEGITGP
jgi:hypothetical protein